MSALVGKSTPTQVDGETRIEDWRLGFVLSPSWTFAGMTQEQDATFYHYTREPLVDVFHRQINAAITIAFQKIDQDWGVARYSAALKSIVPLGWNIEEIYTHEDGRLSLKDGVLYLIRYNDPQGNEHTSYVVHATNEGIGIQIVLDVTSDPVLFMARTPRVPTRGLETGAAWSRDVGCLKRRAQHVGVARWHASVPSPGSRLSVDS